ncbi:hypothetical protein BRADI_1g41150v3 [Brachypodium distachyon]|uniref:Uncharacterized protein n=1 Tax=Brachypodium distachyon TaxID=15368 RepID=A0A0Q3NLH8_BRADI|nr:hypothetical protein BRADI_1g41150v3 [Brachypodium distachyon]
MAPASKVMGHLAHDGGIVSYAVYAAAPCDACCGGSPHRKAEADDDDDDDDYDCAPAA